MQKSFSYTGKNSLNHYSAEVLSIQPAICQLQHMHDSLLLIILNYIEKKSPTVAMYKIFSISASAGTLAMDYLQVSHLYITVNSAAGIPWGVSGMARFSIQDVN